MIKLSGQALADFVKWFWKGEIPNRISNFDNAPDAMKFGVIQDWGNSVEIYISVSNTPDRMLYSVEYWSEVAAEWTYNQMIADTLEEAREKAVEELDKKHNDGRAEIL